MTYKEITEILKQEIEGVEYEDFFGWYDEKRKLINYMKRYLESDEYDPYVPTTDEEIVEIFIKKYNDELEKESIKENEPDGWRNNDDID